MLKIFKILLKTKFSFKLPKKNKIIFLDNVGLDILKNFFKNQSFTLVKTRFEVINLYILFLSFKINLSLTLHQKYILTYILFVNPKYIITCNDNSFFFLKIKNILSKNFKKKIHLILIQNAVRGGIGDLFYEAENYKKKISADYVLCQNDFIGKKYKNILKCNYKKIGLIKNNHFFNKKNTKDNKSLVFISSVSDYNISENEKLYNGKKNISWKKFFEVDKLIFQIVEEFCKKKNIKFYILEKKKNSFKEQNFYYKISKYNNFLFLKQQFNETNPYYFLNYYNNFVFIDSSLGYEALSRGRKAFAISARNNILKTYTSGYHFNFSWPNKDFFNKNGFFWENKVNKNIIFNKLERILNLRNKEWKKKIYKFQNQVLKYDFQNKKCKFELKKIIRK